MGEFATSIRTQGETVLQAMFHETAPKGTDPILQLMACLLDDGAGGVLSPPEVPVTTEQWFTWNRLALEVQPALVRTMTREIETERTELPAEMDALRRWAAELLLSTLDRLGML